MGFFNYPSWLTIEIKLVPRIDMRRLELKYIFSKLIVYITLFTCNLIDTYTQGKFPKNKFINFYMQTPKKNRQLFLNCIRIYLFACILYIVEMKCALFLKPISMMAL